MPTADSHDLFGAGRRIRTSTEPRRAASTILGYPGMSTTPACRPPTLRWSIREGLTLRIYLSRTVDRRGLGRLPGIQEILIGTGRLMGTHQYAPRLSTVEDRGIEPRVSCVAVEHLPQKQRMH